MKDSILQISLKDSAIIWADSSLSLNWLDNSLNWLDINLNWLDRMTEFSCCMESRIALTGWLNIITLSLAVVWSQYWLDELNAHFWWWRSYFVAN